MRHLLKAALIVGSIPLSWNSHVPLCEYEDGSSQYMCVWDARHQGNNEGSSALIIRGGHNNAVTIPLSHRLAHRLTH